MAETTRTYPSELPVLALRQTVVFPLTLQPLAISRAASVEAVNRALSADRLVFLTLQATDNDEPEPSDLHTIGTIGAVRQMARVPAGVHVIVEGLTRARADLIARSGASLLATVSPFAESAERTLEVDAYVRRLQELVDRALAVTSGLSQEIRGLVSAIDDPLRLAYVLASLLDIKADQKQKMLESPQVAEKLKTVADSLTHEIALLEIKGKIESTAQKEMTNAERQYYLRQQLKAIQDELGEGEKTDIQEIRARLTAARLPEAVAKATDREVERLERMTPASPEFQMIRTYIDWVLDVPWSTTTEDRLDPVAAREVLDADHYDLDKVKERIVEYLAVHKLKSRQAGEGSGSIKGPILCFVGPPGVGKTSLGQSIARAMNRKFVRISLGGVRDEAEIRGHRRTYIGSMPGRIVQALKQAGAMNPVFMLDEIDKVSAGFQGDPAAALLEVLDPAQNHAFRDHYLEINIDLSRVLFIATANQLGTVHPALLDRMEMLHLAGYSEEEKLHIARRYLIPRQLQEHGLATTAVTIEDDAVRHIVSEYTREAGVRSLERQIGATARKIAARIAGASSGLASEPVLVRAADLRDYLGPPRFHDEVSFRVSRPGVATGVAWTETGGDVLFVEASLLPSGHHEIILTGQLGSVMQESAKAAVSHIRAQARELGISPEFLDRNDLHIHVPAGAIPKDGPSAGVTMATAIVSALRNQPVRDDVAMTGEITLSGLVLPVGGIREKALAARRHGIKEFILPARNEPDLAELPPEVRAGMRFVPVKTLEEVLKAALPAPVLTPASSSLLLAVRIAFYVSGHGFGHASRSIELINALAAARPDVRVIVRSTLPAWLFESARATLEIRPGDTDTGVVQIDSLRLDEEETARRAAAFHLDWNRRVAEEGAALREMRADAVLGDIPPLAFAAASIAGLPSVALGNFTWDWIYGAYPAFETLAPAVIPAIRRAYAGATRALRLPLHGGFAPMADVVRDIPFIARRSTRDPRDTRRLLGVPADRPLVLASFGAYGVELPYDRLAQSRAFSLLTVERQAPHGLSYPDLVAAADVVVSKPGYGIVSECVANQTALLYTSRGHFIEYDVFVAGMPDVLRCRYITNEDLMAGRWEEAIGKLLDQPEPPTPPRVDGAHVAATEIVNLVIE